MVAERPELVKELQQNLLNDIPVEQAAQAKPINRWALVPGVLLLLAVTVGFYLKTGGLAQVLDWRWCRRKCRNCASASPMSAPNR